MNRRYRKTPLRTVAQNRADIGTFLLLAFWVAVTFAALNYGIAHS